MVIREPGFYVYEPNLPFTAYMYEDEGAVEHWHPYWEMLCQIEGETNINIGSRTYLSKVGAIDIIGPEEPHSTQCISGKHKLLVVQFETSTIVPYLFSFLEAKYLSYSLIKEFGYKKHFRITYKNDHVHEVMDKILDEFDVKDLGYELEVQSLLMHLFSFFIRNGYISIPNIPRAKLNAIIQMKPILAYIESNYQEKLALQYIAAKANISPYNFCRIFKNATNMTMTEYINNVRLNEAERRVLTTNEPISSISFAVGFSNVNYFNRLFKKKYNISPTAYQKQYSAISEQEKPRKRDDKHYMLMDKGTREK